MDQALARGVIRQLFRNAQYGNDRFADNCDRIIGRKLKNNIGRIRMRPKDVQSVVEALHEEARDNPSVLQLRYDRGARGRDLTVAVSLLVPMRSMVKTVRGADPAEYNALGVNQVEFSANDKAMRLRHWFSPVQFTYHSLWRYMNRCCGDDTSAARSDLYTSISDAVIGATLWSVTRKRLSDPTDDTLQKNRRGLSDVVLPQSAGAFCGTFANPKNADALEAGYVCVGRHGIAERRDASNLQIVNVRTTLASDQMTAHQAQAVGVLDELMDHIRTMRFEPRRRALAERDMMGWPAKRIDGSPTPFSDKTVFQQALQRAVSATDLPNAFNHWSAVEEKALRAGVEVGQVHSVAARKFDRDLREFYPQTKPARPSLTVSYDDNPGPPTIKV